jgi:hypothetical protein
VSKSENVLFQAGYSRSGKKMGLYFESHGLLVVNLVVVNLLACMIHLKLIEKRTDCRS